MSAFERVAPGVKVRPLDLAGFGGLEAVVGATDADADPNATLPLVISFHGRTDQPRTPGQLGSLPARRWVLPAGPDVDPPGFAWLPRSLTGLPKVEAEVTAALPGRVAALAGLIDALQETRPVAGKPIVTGFSQGGVMALSLAVLAPERIAAAIAIAAWFPEALLPAKGGTRPPIQAIHGTADPVVPFAPLRALVPKLRALGHAVDWLELDGVGHDSGPLTYRPYRAWLEARLAGG
ncbi:MAG: dienelactone hydrolase family protein [Myxococcota bacterium]